MVMVHLRNPLQYQLQNPYLMEEINLQIEVEKGKFWLPVACRDSFEHQTQADRFFRENLSKPMSLVICILKGQPHPGC